MLIVYSTARRLTTGSEPGSPRQTGHTLLLGSAPKPAGQPQNIFDAVLSSTCVSSPITGSYRRTASSKATSAAVSVIAWASPCGNPFCQAAGLRKQRMSPALLQRGLHGAGDPVEPVVGQHRGHHLKAHRQAILVGQAARHRDGGVPGQVGRDRA